MTKIEISKGIIKKKGIPKGFIITDENISKLYPELITKNHFIIKPDEKSKSFENYKKIIEKLSKTNEQTIIALGGGVVGDLAGFVASTYKRGIDLIQIPTTLLAMIDSSIGGKNGINLRNKKNYLGTIYQPKLVLIDSDFLKTLPEKEFQNGIAEAIKYFAIFEKPKIEIFQKKITKESDLTKAISECCKLKVEVIKKDEKDKNYRHVLNFGHTIGHAIELLYNLNHGQAVSIGMIKELQLAIKKRYATTKKLEQIKKALIINNLPTQLPKNFNVEKILGIMKQDKKGKFIFAFDKENYNVQLNEEIIKEILK